MIPTRNVDTLGVYAAAVAQQTVVEAAQDGTSTGFLWAHIPTAGTKKARIRRVYVSSHHSTVLATPTAPRIRLVRMTFTGTASGAAVTPCKLDALYPTAALDLRTAVTGLTPTLVAAAGSAALVGALTAVGAYVPCRMDLFDDRYSFEDERLVIAAGEGIVIYQDTAGTAADTRKLNLGLVWDEYTA